MFIAQLKTNIFLGIFTVYGISTQTATAEIGSYLWTDKMAYGTNLDGDFRITHLPEELEGSYMLLTEYLVDAESISILATIDTYIRVALMGPDDPIDPSAWNNGRDGGLIDILPTEGWLNEAGWYVEQISSTGNIERLSSVWSKALPAGTVLTFTSVYDDLTFAIFATEGEQFYITTLIFRIKVLKKYYHKTSNLFRIEQSVTFATPTNI